MGTPYCKEPNAGDGSFGNNQLQYPPLAPTSIEGSTCPICQDTEPYTVMYALPCAHKFHELCINEWLKKKLICPICRLRVDHSSNMHDDEGLGFETEFSDGILADTSMNFGNLTEYDILERDETTMERTLYEISDSLSDEGSILPASRESSDGLSDEESETLDPSTSFNASIVIDLVTDSDNEPEIIESDDEPELSESDDEQDTSESCGEPETAVLNDGSYMEPETSESDASGEIIESDNEEDVSDYELQPTELNEPLFLSDSDDDPVLSDSDDDPVLSDSDDGPVLSDSDDDPVLSDSDDNPLLSDSDGESESSTSNNEPVLSDSGGGPELSESYDETEISESNSEATESDSWNE